MKRFISTFLAATMIVASMAVTAFADGYSATLSLSYDDATVTSATVKAGDIVEVFTRLSDSNGTSGVNLNIAYDPSVLTPTDDPDSVSNTDEWDGVEDTTVPYEFYTEYNELAANKKWPNSDVGYGDVEDSTHKFKSFVYGKQTAVTKNCPDILIGAVRFTVNDTTAKSTTIYISYLGITPNGTDITDYSNTVTPVTLTIESDEPTVVPATITDQDTADNYVDSTKDYTWGFTGKVVPGTEIVNGIKFNLTNGSANKDLTLIFGDADNSGAIDGEETEIKISGSSTAVFGVNIYNIPGSIANTSMGYSNLLPNVVAE